MAFGGVFVAEAHRFTGTFNVTLQTSLDADNWITAVKEDGTECAKELSGTAGSQAARWELLAQPGQLFRLAFTNATGDTGYYSYTRTAAN